MCPFGVAAVSSNSLAICARIKSSDTFCSAAVIHMNIRNFQNNEVFFYVLAKTALQSLETPFSYSCRFRLFDVEAVEVHDFVPGFNEVFYELLLSIGAGVDFGDST